MFALREKGGYCPLPNYALVEIGGVDAAKFLQARLSNDVMALAPGEGHFSALLDRKAHILAYVSLHRLDERYFMLMESNQRETVLEQLETYHFQEKVDYKALPVRLFTVQGGLAPLLAPALGDLAITALENGTLVIHRSLCGDAGYIFVFADQDEASTSELSDKAKALNMVPLSEQDLETARVEAGLPLWSVDFDSKNLLPETGLENIAASYAKGCYQGQEVLARIRSYGAPRQGLVGLSFPGVHKSWPLNTPLLLNGEEIGAIKSNVDSPTLGNTIALAYVRREYRVPDRVLEVSINAEQFKATVVTLPFYDAESRRQHASAVYEQALQEFTSGSEIKAIAQLREVIALDPLFADAYEALGVALSRNEQVDEAIDLMKQLLHLEPESIMAHANLSVFYLQQGNKEAAEEEKALAMSIRMAQAAREYKEKQEQEKSRQQRLEEAEHRMSMFEQVLQIDPEDFLANAGMGGAYVDLEEYEKAIPFLRRALQTRPNHTVAYISLARALEKLGDVNTAINVYRDGVAVAAQRGDMTPLKEMQAQLQRLGAK